MITIWGARASRAARCLWALEELGLEYEHRPVGREDGSLTSPAYLAINPAGKAPALQDGEVTMTESYAINLYLAQRYGGGGLWPEGDRRQALVLQWTLWAATEAEPNVIPLVIAVAFTPEDQRDAALIRRCRDNLAARLALLDGALEGQAHLTGETWTIADLNVACVLMTLRLIGFELAAYPNVARWLGACLDREAQRRVAAA